MMPDFLAKSEADQRRIGAEGADRLLDAGRRWDLAPVLRAGGSLIFPHATIDVCGHQIAAVVHACLDTGRPVAVIGVLHGLNAELKEARARAAAGENVSADPARGIQGPSIGGHDDWKREFSLSHFRFLWRREAARRGIDAPDPAEFYPFLAAGHPETLSGLDSLRAATAAGAVIVATMDAIHHGIGYGDTPEAARAPDQGGVELARREIAAGLGILRTGDYASFERHAARTRSDGRDVGQLLRLLLGPLDAEILDLLADDMAPVYQQPDPTWVAGALIALRPASTADRSQIATGRR
ncbi:MAG TPA: hypothetical protein VKT77_01380 [Chthonomonadaceae bacterium]|nr:hypothetical protein [Chthonomonadaceae bacterium]